MGLSGLLSWLPKSLRERLILSRLRFDETELARYRVGLATSREELLAASRLVYAGYREMHIAREHPAQIRYSSTWLLPTTHVLVGKDSGALAASLALVVDGALGLPMAKARPDVVNGLRAQGRRVAEVGGLTIARGHRGRGLIFLMYKAMYLVARDLGVDDLVIAVRGSAVELYRTALCFEPVGPPIRGYPGVENDALYTPMRLPLRESVDLFRKRFGHLSPGWGNPLYLYTQREDAAIQLPPAERRAAYARARLSASTQLITTRPDVLLGEPAQARRLILDVLCQGAQLA